MHHLTQSPVQKDPPRHCFLSISPPDSNSAPLPKRCEGHPAGGPLSGELLLSGGGASQQARGGGQVCSVACIWSQQRNNVSPGFAFSSFSCPLAVHHHLQLSHKQGLVKTCTRKCRRGKNYTSMGKAVTLDLLQPVCRGLLIQCED